MGIQINGQTDTISAGDGSFTVEGLEGQTIAIGAGASVFSPAANTLALGTNGSERVRIDSSGNVGVGTDTPRNISNFKSIAVDATSGSFIDYVIAGTRIGTIAADSNGFNAEAVGASTPFRVVTNGSERLRVLAAGGLTFNGDTAAANALDDYEEGTWTPTLAGSTGGSLTYGTQFGRYTKIGSNYFVYGYITWTATTLTGNLRWRGWPVPLNEGNVNGPMPITYVYGVTYSGLLTVQLSTSFGAEGVLLAGNSQVNGTALSSSGGLGVMGWYRSA